MTLARQRRAQSASDPFADVTDSPIMALARQRCAQSAFADVTDSQVSVPVRLTAGDVSGSALTLPETILTHLADGPVIVDTLRIRIRSVVLGIVRAERDGNRLTGIRWPMGVDSTFVVLVTVARGPGVRRLRVDVPSDFPYLYPVWGPPGVAL